MIDEIMVSVCMISYNHENYIRKSLESVIAQKTKFKFEILIHDDASLDNSANIIKEYELKYPDMIKPIYQTENQFSKGKIVSKEFNYPRVKGKYVAFCECDDFWSDEYKLQKQVDFLENNTDIYSVAHRYMIVDKDNNITGYSHIDLKLDSFFNKEDALKFKSGLFHLSTIMFRSSIIQDHRFLRGFDECCILGAHTYMIYYFAQLSDIYIMKECMSAWRFVQEKDGTSYSSRANNHKITYQIKLLDMYYRYKVFFQNEYDFKPVVREMLLITIKVILKNKESEITKIAALKECLKIADLADILILPVYEIKRRVSNHEK